MRIMRAFILTLALLLPVFVNGQTVTGLYVSQSNFGADTEGNPTPSPNAGLEIWDATNSFNQWTTNAQASWAQHSTTWVYHLGQQIILSGEAETVRFLGDAMGGFNVKGWLSDGGVTGGAAGSRHGILFNKIAAYGGQFDFVLYSQGEENSSQIEQGNETLSDFQAWFTQLQSELIATGSITAQTPWIIMKQKHEGTGFVSGQPTDNVNPFWDSVVPPFYALNNEYLPVRDGVHWTQDSLIRIGELALFQYRTIFPRLSILTPVSTVSAKIVGGNVEVIFTGSILESSTDLINWTPISGAASPFTDAITDPQRFYRTK